MSDTVSGGNAPPGAGSDGDGPIGPKKSAKSKRSRRRGRGRRRNNAQAAPQQEHQPHAGAPKAGHPPVDNRNQKQRRSGALSTRAFNEDSVEGDAEAHHGAVDGRTGSREARDGAAADGSVSERRKAKNKRRHPKRKWSNAKNEPQQGQKTVAAEANTQTARTGQHDGSERRKQKSASGKSLSRRPNDAKRSQSARADDTAKHNPDRKRNPRPHSDATNPKPWPAYAALDLGTNNCRLLIATPQQPGRFRVVDAFSRIVRLGEGLGASGQLSDAAMDRAVSALRTCASKLKGRDLKGTRLIATEACRRAGNGTLFLDRVRKETGLELEIVDRETEARLAVSGCASLVDREASGVVLFDIGGGSSELALLDLKKRKRHDLGPAMVSWTSLPFGVVTLSEKHGGGRAVTQAVFDAMVEEVSEHIRQYEGRHALAEVFERGEVHLLGTSGTVTTLAGIHLKLPRYDRRVVDGTWMSSRQITAMIDELVAMGYDERVKNPCIGQDRADLVLAGCAILVAIQRMWPCERLRVADRGLREGLLTDMMNRDNAWLRFNRHERHNRHSGPRSKDGRHRRGRAGSGPSHKPKGQA